MNDDTEMNSDPMTGYVMAPTPAQATEWVHLDELVGRTIAGNESPVACIEQHGHSDGRWRYTCDHETYSSTWRPLTIVDHCVKVIVPPPSPETVVVVDANTAHALIGRSVAGSGNVKIDHFTDYGPAWSVYGFGGVYLAGGDYGESVSLDPLPAPPPEEEVETVTVVLAALHEAMQTYRGFRGDGSLAADAAHLARWMDESYDRLHAALAAVGGE